MAWRRIVNEPLSDPMLTRFIDAYMRDYGEMSWRILHTFHLIISLILSYHYPSINKVFLKDIYELNFYAFLLSARCDAINIHAQQHQLHVLYSETCL